MYRIVCLKLPIPSVATFIEKIVPILVVPIIAERMNKIPQNGNHVILVRDKSLQQ
jgi:hypothetical protein